MNTYFTDIYFHKPTDEYKRNLKDALMTFVRTTLGEYYHNNKVYVENIDFILKMVRNFCKVNHIGTLWVDKYLEPRMRFLVKKGRKTIDFKHDEISTIFEENVLKYYKTNDPYKIEGILSKKHKNCKQLDRYYRNPMFKSNNLYNLTYNDVECIIDYLGMQKDRDEIINQRFYRSENITRYCKNSLPEFEEEIKELCKMTGANYLGVIEQPEHGTYLNEDEIFICNVSSKSEQPYYTANGLVRAYSLGIIMNLEYHFSGLSRY